MKKTKNNFHKKFVVIGLSIIILIGILYFYLNDNNSLRIATEEELNTYYDAVETNNVELCHTLDPRAEKLRVYFWDYETKEFELRNHCFRTIAKQTKNPELCEELIYLGDAEVEEYVDEGGTKVSTTLGVFNAYKEACIQEASDLR